MTSALQGEGGSGKADEGTDKLLEWDSNKGEEVRKSGNFWDVINGSSLGVRVLGWVRGGNKKKRGARYSGRAIASSLTHFRDGAAAVATVVRGKEGLKCVGRTNFSRHEARRIRRRRIKRVP